jgi:thiol-disulfide isomerase/thioredoxin
MLELGTPAPEFSLPDADGNQHGLGDGADAYVVMFICNHCPFVKHVREELAQLGSDYGNRDVAIVAINSNDIENYPADGPEHMKLEAEKWGYSFPYLIDESQDVAKSYMAACTPDFFVFGPDKRLVYRGQLDDSRPSNNEPIDGHDVRAALDAILSGGSISERQIPSIGCSIKWKPGNIPDYG